MGITLLLLLIGTLVLAFNIQPVLSDGTVSGKVTESNGVTPIVGVLVEALQQGDLVVSSTTTDADGNYSLSLTEGAYKVRASAAGYLTAIEPVVDVTTGTTTVDFNLTRGQMLVFDEFTGTSLNASKWNSHVTGSGSIAIYNQTSQPTNFSEVGINTGSPGSGSGAITSKLNASVNSTMVFEGIIDPYAGSNVVWGDKQPRGLRAGTDANNAIEFVSALSGGSSTAVQARTVANGSATTTTYDLGDYVHRYRVYRIEANSSVVNFYVDGALVATHATNIPTVPLNVYVGSSYDGTGNIYVDTDYLYLAELPELEVSVYPEIIVGPPPKIGETFDVNITIANVEDLYTWQAGMTFNASVLECLSIAEGEFLKRAGVPTLWTPGTINNDTGTISYSACSITGSTPGVSGYGQLMSITFRVIGSGNSTLHITDVLLLDSDLVSITPVTIVDGYVEIHVQDISILSVTKSAAEAYPTWIVPFNVTVVVENQGTRTETFNVTAYASAIEIGKQEVTLAAGANTTLEFNWNLAGVAEDTYTIRAEATILYGEIDILDNTLIEGTVKIKHPGDANDDSIVNAYDLGILAKAWTASGGTYDARADFNGDGTIDELDHDILKAYWP